MFEMFSQTGPPISGEHHFEPLKFYRLFDLSISGCSVSNATSVKIKANLGYSTWICFFALLTNKPPTNAATRRVLQA